jgi:hypothetical protein
MSQFWSVSPAVCMWMASSTGTIAATPDPSNSAATILTKSLYAGNIAQAQSELTQVLASHPADQEARYALGMAQLVGAVEHFGQSMYRYGLESPRNGLQLPFLRFPVPSNPQPENFSYEKARAVLQTFVNDLAAADESLIAVDDSHVLLPINIGSIRLDLNMDGKADEDEALWQIFAKVSTQQFTEQQASTFQIRFDAGDASWMRGYTHVLRAMAEFLLAYDWHEGFDLSMHRFFPRSHLPSSNLDALLDQQRPLWEAFNQCVAAKKENSYQCWDKRPPNALSPDFVEGADLIAFIHLMHWPINEPERMQRVLHHLEAMVVTSRESWRLILAETDNDHEWIPSPVQTGVMPGMVVTQQVVDGWLGFLDQLDDVLQRKLLLGHWRLPQGINIRRVFLEPTTFDPILWIQGSAALPYLEDGPLARADTWRRLMQVFGGDFFRYAVWFN